MLFQKQGYGGECTNGLDWSGRDDRMSQARWLTALRSGFRRLGRQVLEILRYGGSTRHKCTLSCSRYRNICLFFSPGVVVQEMSRRPRGRGDILIGNTGAH